MNIVFGSAWRDSARNCLPYMSMVDKFVRHAGPGHHVSVIAVEGDSRDNTQEELWKSARRFNIDLRLIQFDQGTPRYGSVEHPERMSALSQVGNEILNTVQETDDVLVYVESDLMWDAHTIGSLVDIANERREGVDIVAPLVFAGDHFYDVWAFRGVDGTRFAPFWPYHFTLKSTGMTKVNSVGSCLIMRGEIARQKSIRMNDGALVDYCTKAREVGQYVIAAHSDFKVTHP